MKNFIFLFTYRVQNFRLHDEFNIKKAENQSIDVTRINSMFHDVTQYPLPNNNAQQKQHHKQQQKRQYSKNIINNNEYSMNESDCVETVEFQKLIKCKIDVQNSNTITDKNNIIPFDNTPFILHNTKDWQKDNDHKKRVDILTTISTKTETTSSGYNLTQEHFSRFLSSSRDSNSENLVDKKNITKSDPTENNKKIKQKRIEKKNSFLNQVTNGKSVFENMKKFIVRKSSATIDLNRNVNNAESQTTNGNLTEMKKENCVKNEPDTVDYW